MYNNGQIPLFPPHNFAIPVNFLPHGVIPIQMPTRAPMHIPPPPSQPSTPRIQLLTPAPPTHNLKPVGELVKVQHDRYYNFSPVMGENIVACHYFNTLADIQDFPEMISKATDEVTHLEPITKSRTPSKCFCFLYKFAEVGLSISLLEEMLNSNKSNVKGLGMLYIRLLVPPKELFQWFKRILHDQTRIQASNEGPSETIAEYAFRLLKDIKYYGHALPKIPVPIHRLYRKKLLGMKIQEKRNRRYRAILRPGEKVMAMYHEDTNFYAATIERFEETTGNWLVHFTDYDEKQECSLGQIKISRGRRKAYLERSRGGDSQRSDRGEVCRGRRRRSRSRSPRGDYRRKRRRRSRERDDRGHSRTRSPSQSPDLDKLIREEDANAQCVYNARDCAKGVMGYKMSLCSSNMDSGRLFDPDAFTKAPLVVNHPKNKEIYGPSRQRQKEIAEAKTRAKSKISAPVKTQSKAHQSMMQKLYERYGNAASKKKPT